MEWILLGDKRDEAISDPGKRPVGTGDMFLFSSSLPLTIQEKVYEADWGEIIECKDVISHILFMSNIPG